MLWRKLETDILSQCLADDSCPVTLRALIPSRKAGAVIGKGGHVARQIEDLCNVRLAMSEFRTAPHRLLTVCGEPSRVGRAWREIMYRMYDPEHERVQFGETLAVNFLIPKLLADTLLANQFLARMHAETRISLQLRRRPLVNSTDCMLTITVSDLSLSCLGEFETAVGTLAQGFDAYKYLALSPLNVYYVWNDDPSAAAATSSSSPEVPLDTSQEEISSISEDVIYSVESQANTPHWCEAFDR